MDAIKMIETSPLYQQLTPRQQKELLVLFGACLHEQSYSSNLRTQSIQSESPPNRSGEVAPTSSDSPPEIDKQVAKLTNGLTNIDKRTDKHCSFSSSRYRITSKARREELLLDTNITSLLDKIIKHVCQFSENAKVPNDKGDKLYCDWLYYIDQMRKTDGIELNEIDKVFDWMSNSEFWTRIIVSPSGLRRNWDELKKQFVNAKTDKRTDKRKKDKEEKDTYGTLFLRKGGATP